MNFVVYIYINKGIHSYLQISLSKVAIIPNHRLKTKQQQCYFYILAVFQYFEALENVSSKFHDIVYNKHLQLALLVSHFAWKTICTVHGFWKVHTHRTDPTGFLIFTVPGCLPDRTQTKCLKYVRLDQCAMCFQKYSLNMSLEKLIQCFWPTDILECIIKASKMRI